jgi:hypothetical protein
MSPSRRRAVSLRSASLRPGIAATLLGGAAVASETPAARPLLPLHSIHAKIVNGVSASDFQPEPRPLGRLPDRPHELRPLVPRAMRRVEGIASPEATHLRETR